MSDKPDDQLPKKRLGDVEHTAIKTLAALIPYVGGSLAELFNYLVAPPIEKRRDQWLKSLYDGLKGLEQKYEQFETGAAFENEEFVTTFLQATRHALVNHEKENLRALRNTVLNSALSSAPSEVRQKIFVDWAGELTAWHIRILKLFADEPSRIPEIHLSDSSWQMNIAADRLASLIEERYPETRGNYHLYMQIVGDLNSKGLLTNLLPEKGMASRIEHRPVLSPIAEDFLGFITSPIEEDEESKA
ncbi:MAG: hypothetical protein IT320_20205 [Anaerolineae bacterium]|nr:hypothetical protein [Anaerolineae bacterium]